MLLLASLVLLVGERGFGRIFAEGEVFLFVFKLVYNVLVDEGLGVGGLAPNDFELGFLIQYRLRFFADAPV